MSGDAAMRFGLNLPNYSSLGHRDAMIAIAERADELGYTSLWTSDHILLPTSLPDPFGNLLESFTTLSYLAARTEHIGLATGVLVLPQRDPLLVAKQAATVHHLSGGRLTLGIGVGWIPEEYGYLRADFHSRGALADEYIAAMRTLFERFGDRFREGDAYMVNDPFDGASHTPDIFVVKPAFADGTLVGFAVTVAHHSDLGGRVPGTIACPVCVVIV